MLGLAMNLPPRYRSVFLSFAERGLSQALLDRVRGNGFEGHALRWNVPHFGRAVREVADHLRRLDADVLCCSGYKPDLIGWRAARQAGVPVVSVSHGWTGATWKVRMYETLNRWILRWMDAVVCVSEAQAGKVRRAGVQPDRMVVIHNSIGPDSFAPPEAEHGRKLKDMFAVPPRYMVGAAGRLSPEKGFDQLVEAAAIVLQKRRDVGFVVFGDGPMRDSLTRQVHACHIEGQFVLGGFRSDVGRFFPHLDLAVLPSFTEGLPVVLLETYAAGVPAVATAVGGTPELVDEGVNGYLVPPGDPLALSRRILDMLSDDQSRRAMGACGQQRVREEFSFSAQATQYQELFERLRDRGSTQAEEVMESSHV
jgi:glycosyltransferase involved in cell wall biosynthesis